MYCDVLLPLHIAVVLSK